MQSLEEALRTKNQSGPQFLPERFPSRLWCHFLAQGVFFFLVGGERFGMLDWRLRMWVWGERGNSGEGTCLTCC